MANKRVPLSQRRASDARGIDVIFGGAPASPETEATPNEPAASEVFSQEGDVQGPGAPVGAVSPGGALSVPAVNASLSTAAPTPAVEIQEAPPKPVLAKVTIYIRPEQVIAIESIQLAQRQRTGKKPDKSDLLQEAVDLLIAKYEA